MLNASSRFLFAFALALLLQNTNVTNASKWFRYSGVTGFVTSR